MRVAIFSDVHGHLPALERFVEKTRREVDAYLCLGDVVNYGPWNDECLELVHSLPGLTFLAGNHEKMFADGCVEAGAAPLVAEFFAHSFAAFRRFDLIAGLPQTCDLGRFRCAHTIAGQRIFADTDIAIETDWIIGHTHHAFAVCRGPHALVNVGSIGQNRRFIDVMNFAIYDGARDAVTLCDLASPIDVLLAEFEARAFPPECIEYYRRKPRRDPPPLTA